MSVTTATVAVMTVAFSAWSIHVTTDNATRDRALAQRGQASDRYSKAVEQLGSDSTQIRLGGVYALEQLLHDSPIDEEQILNVLIAYVLAKSPRNRCPAIRNENYLNDSRIPVPPPLSEVQAILTIVGKSNYVNDHAVSFSGTCLERYDMSRLNFRNVHFFNSDVSFSHFEGTDLRGADFGLASARSVNFSNSDLSNSIWVSVTALDSRFINAKLVGVTMGSSELSGSYFAGADVAESSYYNADLSGADFQGVKNIAKGDFYGFAFDQSPPIWPVGFKPPLSYNQLPPPKVSGGAPN